MQCIPASHSTPLAACRAWVLAAALGFLLAPAVFAQASGGPEWNQLSPSEQHVLEPLRGQWSTIDPARKAKWREVAGRYPSLSADEQQRLRGRMVDWDGMSAAQRSEARNRFRESNQLPASERQAQWEAYQSLRPEQREALAARAANRPGAPAAQRETLRRPEAVNRPADAARPVAPGLMQARPGASTRPLLQAPVPPRHQQPGLPKIAATPGFVDSKTLLPQRGPQGAAAAQPKRRNKDNNQR
jgi:hypothetical protein